MKSITISADNLYIAISAYKQLRTISIDFAPIINNEITIYFNDFRFVLFDLLAQGIDRSELLFWPDKGDQLHVERFPV